MPYRFKTGESLQHGVRRVVSGQIDRALAELADTTLDRSDTIHQVRKRCKKIRAALRLVRSGLASYPEENAWYRDAARRISDVRDAEAMIETCDALSRRCAGQVDATTMQALRDRLEGRRNALFEDTERIDGRLREFEASMVAGRERAESLEIHDEGYATALAGMSKTYARAREAMDAVLQNPTPENVHQWRKRVKYHGYHVRLLRDAWAPVMQAVWEEVGSLGALLGDHHDLCVLKRWVIDEQVLSEDAGRLDDFIRFVDARTARLEEESRPLGGRLFAEKPKHLERRFAIYLGIWCKQG